MPDDSPEHRIVVHLDQILAARGMTLTQLADLAGITAVNLSVLKNGRSRAIRFSTLTALCHALDCSPGDLLSCAPPSNEVHSTLTLDSLLTAAATRSPEQKKHDLFVADAANLGLHAQMLGDEYLARNDLTTARRWYQLAADYDVPEAAEALASIDATTTPEPSTDTTNQRRPASST